MLGSGFSESHKVDEWRSGFSRSPEDLSCLRFSSTKLNETCKERHPLHMRHLLSSSSLSLNRHARFLQWFSHKISEISSSFLVLAKKRKIITVIEMYCTCLLLFVFLSSGLRWHTHHVHKHYTQQRFRCYNEKLYQHNIRMPLPHQLHGPTAQRWKHDQSWCQVSVYF